MRLELTFSPLREIHAARIMSKAHCQITPQLVEFDPIRHNGQQRHLIAIHHANDMFGQMLRKVKINWIDYVGIGTRF